MEEQAQQILARGTNDGAVQVVIPNDLTSLLSGPGIDSDATSLLLMGFVAGDLRPQYATGVKGDDVVAGLRGVLQVARALQVSSPELDDAAARERAGTLAGWAHDWLAAHRSEERPRLSPAPSNSVAMTIPGDFA